MTLQVMSADSRMDLIYLPPDTFTSRMGAKWADRAPRVVERDGGGLLATRPPTSRATPRRRR